MTPLSEVEEMFLEAVRHGCRHAADVADYVEGELSAAGPGQSVCREVLGALAVRGMVARGSSGWRATGL